MNERGFYLTQVLETFNAPINEEQAWAICYLCAGFLRDKWKKNQGILPFKGMNDVNILFSRDGQVISLDSNVTALPAQTEYELVDSLGCIIYQALDYGLRENQQQDLSSSMENLIGSMTVDDEIEQENDEGIENDVSDENMRYTLDDVIQVCETHVSNEVDVVLHYKAVCRALIAEAQELGSFLEKIDNEKCVENRMTTYLDDLCRWQWTQLWVQVMSQLRQGVKLRKVQHISHPSLEYELTPFEMMMEDIKLCRYSLKGVSDEEAYKHKITKDAHDLILEFIRSRPPLVPVSNRKISKKPPPTQDAREILLESIRRKPPLKPVDIKIVEPSNHSLTLDDEPAAPVRKLIKPDFSLFTSTSFEDGLDKIDSEENVIYIPQRNKISAPYMSPLVPTDYDVVDMSPKNVIQPLNNKYNVTDYTERENTTRSSIPSKKKPMVCLDPSLECLSLTIEEVMHIRHVLTKAEIECLISNPDLQALLTKGKICFSCKTTKFSWFGNWATRCKMCKRNVCNKCCNKMRIPTEHFEHIPVYTLSPSPCSPPEPRSPNIYSCEKDESMKPDILKKSDSLFQMHTDFIINDKNNYMSCMSKSYSVARPMPKHTQGPLMNVCKECKSMVVKIIKASRSTLASAPDILRERSPIYNLPSHKADRNFHLNIKPVYQ